MFGSTKRSEKSQRFNHLQTKSEKGGNFCQAVAGHDGLKSHSIMAIMAIMKKASITEAKNNFSALIDGVKSGSPVLIVDRGRPVARLEPVSGVRSDDDSRLARLVREGIVRPARAAVSKTVFTTKPPRLKGSVSGVRVLLDERREGR